jgi:four helix bundle protein
VIEQYKFQDLFVYQLALDYIDKIYSAISRLPDLERFNISSQITRAATSIALNIAEGSTSQSDPEQHRFLGLALRSYLETIACLDLIQRRAYLDDHHLTQIRKEGHQLFMKLVAFRKTLSA